MAPGTITEPEKTNEWKQAYKEGYEAGKQALKQELKTLMRQLGEKEAFLTVSYTVSSNER